MRKIASLLIPLIALVLMGCNSGCPDAGEDVVSYPSLKNLFKDAIEPQLPYPHTYKYTGSRHFLDDTATRLDGSEYYTSFIVNFSAAGFPQGYATVTLKENAEGKCYVTKAYLPQL